MFGGSLIRAGTSARAGVGAREGAVETIRALAATLAQDVVPMRGVGDLWRARLPAPQLLPVGIDDAARAAEDLRTLVRWVDDGECFSRAVYGAARTEQLLAGRATGLEQARHAAVAVVPTSHRRTGWTFHAATAFRAAEDDAVKVVDHLLGARTGRASGIFGIDEWAGLLGRRAEDVRIQLPVDNIPTGGGPITVPASARKLRGMAARLERSISRAATR